MEPTYLLFDYETFSECDLKASGAWEYANHPSTEILCVGYVAGTREEIATAEPRLLVPRLSDMTARDTEFLKMLTDPDVVLVAHNAFFEQVITRFVLTRYGNLLRSKEARAIPPSRFICTASLARAVGLPGNLEGAGKAIGLEHQKDLEGHKLMLKLCKPRKPTKADASTRHAAKADYDRLYEYCLLDIAAERELFLKLPPLHPKERKIWVLNQEMNLRGFAVDRELVTGALHCIAEETELLDGRFRELTGLSSARQRNETLKVLARHALVLPNLQAATVDEALEGLNADGEEAPENAPDETAREILEIRQAISKSSTAKYAAFDTRSRTDGRARDNTIYYGAHTGRDAGTGLQPQNLFKSTLPHADVMTGLELMRRRDVHAIRALYEKPMELYASAMRSCIVAPAGSLLDVGDFATIEVRALFWLAKHQAGLDALATGADLYIEMASEVYGTPAAKILKSYKAGEILGRDQRQLGKACVLGAGFGMGLNGEKFQSSAKTIFGLDISLSLAQTAIAAYRKRHAAVPKFWDTIETCAMKAVENPGKGYRHGFLTWRKEGKWLTCELPIGRKLWYFSPRLERVNTLYGERVALTYRGVDSKTKQFLRMTTWGGKLTENVVQAVARDLLMEALLRLERKGHVPVLAVHDEIVCERVAQNHPILKSVGDEMFGRMAQAPKWATGFPIKVEGWSEDRYRK